MGTPFTVGGAVNHTAGRLSAALTRAGAAGTLRLVSSLSYPAPAQARLPWRRLSAARAFLVPAAAVLVGAVLADAGPRLLLVVALPVLVAGALANRLPRSVDASLAFLLGVLALGAGLISRTDLLVVAGALYLVAGVAGGWGVNRGRRARRAWANRVLTAVGTVFVAFLVVYPTLLTVDFLAKPRDPIDQRALGLPHERITFAASDGVRLSGWYVPTRNGSAVVLVHGGGGDRQGAIRHARMIAGAGYGVLLYDARGRGESAGHENAAGWEWDRDVRGAVSYLTSRGIHRVALLGLSTGAEAAVTEAASDSRVKAVVADGLQGRTASDAGNLGFANRISIQPALAVIGTEIRLARGETQPKPLLTLVREVARTRPLLVIGTVSFERELDRAYTRGTNAELWELPRTEHTRGLEDHPSQYRKRVLAIFRLAHL